MQAAASLQHLTSLQSTDNLNASISSRDHRYCRTWQPIGLPKQDIKYFICSDFHALRPGFRSSISSDKFWLNSEQLEKIECGDISGQRSHIRAALADPGIDLSVIKHMIVDNYMHALLS